MSSERKTAHKNSRKSPRSPRKSPRKSPRPRKNPRKSPRKSPQKTPVGYQKPRESLKESLDSPSSLYFLSPVSPSHESQEEEEEEEEDPDIGKVVNGYKITSVLGKGSYGKVYAATKKGKSFALKKQLLVEDKEVGIEPAIIVESDVLKRVNHPNVLGAVEIFMDDDNKNLYHVLETAEMDLKKYLESDERKKDTSISYLKQFICGLSYLHRHRLIHADLKPDNLLIFPGNNLKIADFGLVVRDSGADKTLTVQTLWWRAPEVLLGDKKYTVEADIWSLGVITLELLFGTNPFKGDSEIDQDFRYFRAFGTPDEKVWPGISKLSGYKDTFPKWKRKDNVADFLSPDGELQVEKAKELFGEDDYKSLLELALSCLNYDPKKRPTAVSLLKNSLFTGYSCPEGTYDTAAFETKPFSPEEHKEITAFFENVQNLPYLVYMIAEDLLDRVNALIGIEKNELIAYEIVCLFLSNKLIEHESPDYSQFTEMCSCTVKSLVELELEVFKQLDFLLYTDNLLEYCNSDPALIYDYVSKEIKENKLDQLRARIRSHTYEVDCKALAVMKSD
jgi:serine/threonine protein kinase